MRRAAADEGSATVEFALFSLLMLVPFSYVLLTVFDVQRAAYGSTEAARAAGRAFVTSGSSADARQRADAAIGLALHDQGLSADGLEVRVTCSANPCLSPGATVTVTIDDRVSLPWVPALLGRPAATVAVHAVHVQTVDRYRPLRP